MWIRAERVAVLTPTASLRRLTACYAALAVCAALACTTGQPAARAADGREMLAQAIATTRGSYLVYNSAAVILCRCSTQVVTGTR